MNKNFKTILLLLLAIPMVALSSCKKGEAPIGNDPNEGNGTDAPVVAKELDHLIIEEIFYAGNKLKGNDMLSVADRYIKLTNPTKETIYLDGLALVLGKYQPTSPLDYSDADSKHKDKTTAVEKMLVIPGTGKEYPLEPGKSSYIAAVALNTTTLKESDDTLGKVDLSNANFQLYTKEMMQETFYDDAAEDENIEKVKAPVLSLLYDNGFEKDECYAVPSKPEGCDKDYASPADIEGNRLIAIAKLGVTPKEILADKEKYTLVIAYTDDSQGGGHTHMKQFSAMGIPNEWIIDGIVVCANGAQKWEVVDKSIDSGSKGVYNAGEEANLDSYAGKAIVRKHNGKTFEDTNNSTLDFEIKQASLMKKTLP